MPSAFTHAVAALSIGTGFSRFHPPKRIIVAAAICSAVPDLDVIGFQFGVNYEDFWGHRGFTHSFVFALLLSILVVLVFFRKDTGGSSRTLLTFYIFLATASHGVLDAFTNGGLGVAFFSPFHQQRYFFPWTPIRVAPISPARFFSERGLSVFQSELLWVWIPSVVFGSLILLLLHKKEPQQPGPDS